VTGRRGFALAAVLAALVLMAMSVAIAAQRAFVAVRRAGMAEADAGLAAAVAGAQAAISGSVVVLGDTAWSPGTVLASGAVPAGDAVASWQVTRASTSLALAEVTAEWRSRGVLARTRRSGLLTIVPDSAGGARLRVFAPRPWVVLPSP